MYHLIIVDDEEKIRNGIANYFPWDSLGFEVACLAENGRQAFDYLVGGGPADVMLCDVMMPHVNGLELLEMMEESGITGIKVVILSGYREFEYARAALRHGVRDYILKPTRHKELSAVFTKIRQELDAERTAAREAPRAPQREATVVEALREDVRRNYQSISLKEAAERVHLSPFYVSKLFKTRTGQNFYEYLLTVRMEVAMELILGTDLKIYEICERVGYKNQKSFLRVFRRFYPMNPNEYRKNAHG